MDIVTKSESGGFEGYASAFFKLDRHGHVVMPGAFLKSIDKFLREGFIGGIGHDYGKPIGRYTKAHEDDKGLYVVGNLSDVPEAKTVRTLLKDGVLTKLSIGYEPVATEQVSIPELKSIWLKSGYKPNQDDMFRIKQFGGSAKIMLIKEANLLEVSPVSIPSNDDARIMAYKSLGDVPEFSRFIQTARSAAYKLGTKKGRVLSSQNEMKLRAMAEVLSSVSEEIAALLMLVERQPEMDEDTDEDNSSDNVSMTDSATEQVASLQAQDEAKANEEKAKADEEKAKADEEKNERKKQALARIRIIQLTQGV